MIRICNGERIRGPILIDCEVIQMEIILGQWDLTDESLINNYPDSLEEINCHAMKGLAGSL